MTIENRSSSRRVHRWKCETIELIPELIDQKDFEERLERVAEELYSLMNQLHDGESESAPRSYRSDYLIHPGETLEPNSSAPSAGGEGVCDGKEPIQKAA